MDVVLSNSYIPASISQIAVLLMDCQGLYDAVDANSKMVDGIITHVATQISKINIFNIHGLLKSTDLKHLDVSMYCSESIHVCLL